MEMSDDVKRVINNNFVHLATSSKDGKPNVVPVGLCRAISDHELLIVDVFFKKTRKNLEENPQVAIAVEALEELRAYQLKGEAKIFTQGELYERAIEIMKEQDEVREKKISAWREKRPDLAERFEKLVASHHKLRPKAAVLVDVEEIYSTMHRMGGD
ncbi:MAG: pyridoxamine 5'-phosphate oxidase family protein [Euryarchaeota archaeon]|nr:pyridoxamine 5'-phosphate oxidase family protein [Euryarchaeota archaeon]